MASRLLRNIAISIGAGFAAGFGKALVTRQVRRSTTNLSPILTRLEEIETRVKRVEFTPPPVSMPGPEEIEALGTLVSSQREDIASLREDIQRIDRRNAEMVEAFGQKVALMEHQVPVQIEASISSKMTEFSQKLRGEFQEVHHRTVDAFAETLENRVVGRIAALEASLMEQSKSITSLREKSLQTDDHLQRLLGAVERLCAKAEAQGSLLQVPMPLHQVPLREAVPPDLPPAAEVSAPQATAAEARPPETEPQPDLAFAASGAASGHWAQRPAHERIGLKPVGMAILGLAILGLRLATR